MKASVHLSDVLHDKEDGQSLSPTKAVFPKVLGLTPFEFYAKNVSPDLHVIQVL